MRRWTSRGGLLSQPSCDVLLKGNYSWCAARLVLFPGWQGVPGRQCGGLRAAVWGRNIYFPGAGSSPFPWLSNFGILPVFRSAFPLTEGGWFLSSPLCRDGPITVPAPGTVRCKAVPGQKMLLGTGRAGP